MVSGVDGGSLLKEPVFVVMKIPAVKIIINGYFYPFYQWVKIPIRLPNFHLKRAMSAKEGTFLIFLKIKKTRVLRLFN